MRSAWKLRNSFGKIANRATGRALRDRSKFYNVGYFYPDAITRYDGSLTPQIDSTISKTTLLFSFTKIQRKERHLDRIADSTASPFATLHYSTTITLFARVLSYSFCSLIVYFFFSFFFFYSICASVSLLVVLRGVFESFAFLYPGLSCSLLLFWISHRLLSHSRRCYSRIAIATTFYRLLFCPLPHPLPSSFLYPKVVLHLSVVGQSLHIIIPSGQITCPASVSFAVVLCVNATCPYIHNNSRITRL